MVLGTSSGAGKSIITTAICRSLLRKGEVPIPFKGQNMSNNAWVDINNGEMAYSQAVQAWAAGIEPICAMNPVLLKPQGDCTSEVIHLGKSVGVVQAANYYEDWFSSGWEAIQKGLNDIATSYKKHRLILEGAGSPVEINLQHRDLTNLKLAKHLNAKCVLVADIERGGVFAQIIGTLALLKPDEKALIQGIIINRFRGDISLFEKGRQWIEEESKIPVLGIMPWLNEIFPPEDSLDLLERKHKKTKAEIQIAVIKLPSLSNFADLDPLEAEPTIQLNWIQPGDYLGNPNAVIIPGSKQTLKDLQSLQSSGLGNQIKEFASSGGTVFGICGGLQILGEKLEDPLGIEQSFLETSISELEGLSLIPIKTIFHSKKSLTKKDVISKWPDESRIMGFELHHGESTPTNSQKVKVKDLCNETSLGWVNEECNPIKAAGTYLHGIFDNGTWRRLWINQIRKKANLYELPLLEENHDAKREKVINRLTDVFEENINLEYLLKT
ncbi:Cobyric acid synthase [Prochlorococcus sp. SS52]|nr:Cobyric acid synthase [Prochlorococcus marinus str. SS2]KGG35564.1 Cobyric acid synthase [Prochlorococcus sp. SS52]